MTAFIFKKAEMKWWEFAPIKLAMLLIGIAIGARYRGLFEKQARSLFKIGMALGICSLISWLYKKE